MNKKFTLLSAVLLFCGSVCFAQYNYLDAYIGAPVTVTEIGNSTHLINKPRDLDFKPNTNELWIANNGTSSGGSMVIFYNAGLSNQTSQYRKDSHSGHFMAYPPAFAFGDNGWWANANEIKNTASPTSTFMGPALWSGDTSIFARVFQSNWGQNKPLGSHLDMLHQSPFSMGIAHDSAAAYWVADGHNGNIVLYDFADHHGAGYDDHSDGKIWRYTDVSFTREPNVPSHMILDKATGWLYFIDGGTKTIKRLDTNSGTQAGTLTVPSTSPEQLAGYWNITGATVENLDTLSTQPSGIDYHNNRLVVSDYTTGDIYIYNTSGTFTLMGTIATGLPGMMGVKIGPDGRIWAVNHTQSKVYRLDPPAAPPTDAALTSINSPQVESFFPGYYSPSYNYCNGSVSPEITIRNTGVSALTSVEAAYTIDGQNPVSFTWTGTINSGASATLTLPSSAVTPGSHLLEVNIIAVNGSPDDVPQNNILYGSFRAIAAPVSVPYVEDFEANTFPPAGWSYVHFNHHNIMSRATAGGFGNSSASLKMDNFSGSINVSGQVDYLISPMVDMTTASVAAGLSFDVAYAQYNGLTNDRVEIKASTDCGTTWTTLYTKAGAALSTAPASTFPFTPNATQWRTEIVSLSALAAQPEVIFMIATTSNSGNNLFIDDFQIQNITATAENTSAGLIHIYPNPASSTVTLQLTETTESSTVNIFTAGGALVETLQVAAGKSQHTHNISQLQPGIYMIQVISNGKVYHTRLVKY